MSFHHTGSGLDGSRQLRTILVSSEPFDELRGLLIGGLEGDGGAYPECHIAQYPLDLGRKKVGAF